MKNLFNCIKDRNIDANPYGAETEILQENYYNTVAADGIGYVELTGHCLPAQRRLPSCIMSVSMNDEKY